MLEHYKMSRKGMRKQKRASHKLKRDLDIICSETPTKYIAICNAGLVTGLSREKLQTFIDSNTLYTSIIMPEGKSYSFIEFSSITYAYNFYVQVNGTTNLLSANTPLYLTFTESVPDIKDIEPSLDHPAGLKIITNFISREKEIELINSINLEESGTCTSNLKHRKAIHYGYRFNYNDNKVDCQNYISPIPERYKFLQELFKKEGCGLYEYDQLTINNYLPGQGIPPHIDTHSIFEDTILSVSLGSDYVMDFKQDKKKVPILLPRRSLLIMSGESRYAWSHGICPRHSDIIKTECGSTIQERGNRLSLTFRKVRTGDCQCKFPKYCDSDRTSTFLSDQVKALKLEAQYVHEVYEEISSHFSETRQKQWPNVANFLENIQKGSFLIDVGCGNGKYLSDETTVFKVGCDRSSKLLNICQKKGSEVVLADCLKLPYRDNVADAVISIAVIHHLSTYQRRKEAVAEIVRVLKPTGKALLYVWAKEQEKNCGPSAYIKYNRKKKCDSNKHTKQCEMVKETDTILPIHENRTKFTHNDLFVPWKRKGGGEFLRYYHVFEEGELERLCSEVGHTLVKKSYYDQGNWCVILEKDIVIQNL